MKNPTHTEKTKPKLGTTFWLPKPLDKLIGNIMALRGDDKKAQTVKFLIYKALADLGFLDINQMKALGFSPLLACTDFQILFKQQVTSKIYAQLDQLWLYQAEEFLNDTFGAHKNARVNQQRLGEAPVTSTYSTISVFSILNIECKYAFFRWCFDKKLLQTEASQ
jgi:hypothetical protein